MSERAGRCIARTKEGRRADRVVDHGHLDFDAVVFACEKLDFDPFGGVELWGLGWSARFSMAPKIHRIARQSLRCHAA